MPGSTGSSSGQPPVFWLVMQSRGIFGIYTDEGKARDMARLTGNVLTHVPADGDYRPGAEDGAP